MKNNPCDLVPIVTPERASKHTISMLPPAWGGPFVWERNEAGNLVLLRPDPAERAAILKTIEGQYR